VGYFGRHAAGSTGFAVVDLETTGLYLSTDRIVEVGIVHLDADAEVTGQFCTLINPGRDVGPTRLHGIAAADVYDAPSFADAASAVWQLLAGRVLVAHNADFDTRFLDAEFSRCGVQLPPPPVMCTMRLASSYLTGLPARSLPACCAAAGITLSQHHSALADAQAAAGLLARYRAAHRQLPGSWAQALTVAAQTAWLPSPRRATFQPVTRQQQTARRASQRPPLAGLVDRLPRGHSGDTDTYLGVLDRVLEDRIVSADELLTLSGLATELGLKHDTAQQAHRQYLQHLAAAAWRDGHLTDTERSDFLDVALLLDVPPGEALIILADTRQAPQRPGGHQPPALRPGDKVVFTGDMDMDRADIEALATAAGLRVTTAVSSKTALVVAADPHSQSGKAQTARKLGIRLVTEQVFLHQLDQLQAATSSLPM
jgi:DNA polymerase III subunit epsilon